MLTKDKYGTFRTQIEFILNVFMTHLGERNCNSYPIDGGGGFTIKYNGYCNSDVQMDGSTMQHFSLLSGITELPFIVNCSGLSLDGIDLKDFELKFTKAIYKVSDLRRDYTLSRLFRTQWEYIDKSIKDEDDKHKYLLMWEQRLCNDPTWVKNKKELNATKSTLKEEVENIIHSVPALIGVRWCILFDLNASVFIDVHKLINEDSYCEINFEEINLEVTEGK